MEEGRRFRPLMLNDFHLYVYTGAWLLYLLHVEKLGEINSTI